MCFARMFAAVFLSLFLAIPFFGQQPATPPAQSSPQALTLLQHFLAGVTDGQPITDVTLTGTARRIAGSDDETGTAVFKALASGAGKRPGGLHGQIPL